jgi:alpha-L-arabinofuranosidase
MKNFKPAVRVITVILSMAACSPVHDGHRVEIDVSRTGSPIEEYIYGQFIEHLGKCIYGGLWAEMLEDRKFFYPVTYDFSPWGTGEDVYWESGDFVFLDASPWQVIGGEETVSMNHSDPYTGQQSVSIRKMPGSAKAGIRQAGLGVISGKPYLGHIVLGGDKSVLPISVLLFSGPDTVVYRISEISPCFEIYPVEFTPGFSSDSAVFEIFTSGEGELRIGTVSLMPSDNLNGWRRDVVELLKELNSPVYRWPGGNFVSGYNWMDGIGERDKRPPRKNPAWKGVEPNDVGIHEYMDLMKLIDAEPFIAVNTGLGTVGEAAREVEYCNGSSDTEMGKLRALNGHPEPFNVKWWAVGNEMYGSWQLGHMPLEDYVKKHNQAAEAIRRVDPEARLIGVGEVGEWSKTMLSECSDHMDLLSEHIYVKQAVNISDHIGLLARQVEKVANAHRSYLETIPGLKEKNIRIAMDEWNYWYGPYVYGELGVQYHHKDGLGVARGLHEFFRNSDIYFMANYAQTVNVIGCIKTSPTSASFETTGLSLKLYRNHFGIIPVKVEHNNPNLDVSAALTPDRKMITVAVVNSSAAAETILLDFGGVHVSGKARKWIIHHEDPDAFNTPGMEPQVNISGSEIRLRRNTLYVPEYSIVMIALEILQAEG